MEANQGSTVELATSLLIYNTCFYRKLWNAFSIDVATFPPRPSNWFFVSIFVSFFVFPDDYLSVWSTLWCPLSGKTSRSLDSFTPLIKLKLSSSFLLHILKEAVSSPVHLFFSFLSLSPSQGIHFTLIVWQSFPAFMPRPQKVPRIFSSFFEALITFRSTDSPGHNLIMAYRQKK